jgi:hypothetical protein
MTKKLSLDKEFSEHGKKVKHKAIKSAKLVRRSIAKEKGPKELAAQKMREKTIQKNKKI